MNNNLIIGILAAIIIIGGGIWLMNTGSLNSGTVATSTPQTADDTSGQPTVSSASAPRVITGTLVVASNSSAVLTGKIVPNGAQTSYWYEYGTTTNLGSRTAPQTIGSGYTNISAPAFIAGLTANTNYSFRLVAQNSSGTVNGDTLSFTTNNNSPIVGNAPTMNTDAATAVTRTTADLNGRVNPNNSETSYWFEYGDSNNLGNTTDFRSAGAGNSSQSKLISISSLAPGTKYYFRMNAQNQYGTVNGTILVFTTPGPAAAKAPSASTSAPTTLTTSSAMLNGVVNPNGESTSYWFEYATNSSMSNILGSTTHSVTANSDLTSVNVSITLTGLTANTNYSYRLVAMNSFGTVRGGVITFKTKR